MDSTCSAVAMRGRPGRAAIIAIAVTVCGLALLPPSTAAGIRARTVRSDGALATGSGGALATGSGGALATGSGGALVTGSGGGAPSASSGVDSVSLLQCLTSSQPAERSVTFAGEMTLIPGATRMSMRMELLEHSHGERGYRPVLAPGVGVWRTAQAGVKAYKHLEQFTDLSAPASYRVLISFRWLGAHGRVLRRDERRSPRCVEPAVPASSQPT
jgi:hypothetical protein